LKTTFLRKIKRKKSSAHINWKTLHPQFVTYKHIGHTYCRRKTILCIDIIYIVYVDMYTLYTLTYIHIIIDYIKI